MKIPANWRVPDHKRWGKAVWQRVRVYAVFMGVVALGIGFYGVYLWRELPQWEAVSFVRQESMVNEVVPQEKPLPAAKKVIFTASDVVPVRVAMPVDEVLTENAMDDDPVIDEDEAAKEVVAADAQILVQAPRWVYIDPTVFVQKSAPCRAVVSRGYGFTFDERFGDYRFHNGVEYAVDGERSVYAVSDGTVLSVDASSGEVIVGDESQQMFYRPVTDLTVSVGQAVSSGRAIGNVPADSETFYFAMQQKQ